MAFNDVPRWAQNLAVFTFELFVFQNLAMLPEEWWKIDTGQQRAHCLWKAEGGVFFGNVSWKGLKSLTRVVSWSELTVCLRRKSDRNHLRWNIWGFLIRSYIPAFQRLKMLYCFPSFFPGYSCSERDPCGWRLLLTCHNLSVFVVVRGLTGSSHHSSPQSSDCAFQSNTQGVQNVLIFNGLKTEMPFTLKVRKVCDSNRILRLQ